MPHLTLEYSANLDQEQSGLDLNHLCRALADCLISQQADGRAIYPIGGVRVRALSARHYCIANGLADAAFIHGNLKIGAGRSAAVKRATGEALFEVLKSHCAQLYEQTGLALSLEINEADEAASWKHNNLHARFR